VDARTEQALDHLLPADKRTGDTIADLQAAFAESARRRRQNSEDGGAVIAALYEEVKSWRRVGELLGHYSVRTLRRWAEPPDDE